MTRQGEIVCPSTGVALIPSSGHVLYRLAKPRYGGLNPPRRPPGGDRTGWSRFDLPERRTVYAASSPEGAYGELLGALKRPVQPTPAAALFDDVGDATMDELIAQDWAMGDMRLSPYVVDIAFLYANRMYAVTLPDAGWLVDAEHSRTVTFLHEHLPVELIDHGMRWVTVADIRSEDRFVTTHLAEQLAYAPLDGGAVAMGLKFGSKHGSDWDCWAVWLDGDQADAVTVDHGTPVDDPAHNSALRQVLSTFNLLVR